MRSPLTPLAAVFLLSNAVAQGQDSGLYADYHPEGSRWRLAINGRYAGAGLADVAGAYRKAYQDAAGALGGLFGEPAGAQVKGGSGGPEVTADLGYAFLADQGAGLRIAWMSPARIAADLAMDGPYHETVSEYLTMSMWSVMVGGWMEHRYETGVRLRGSVYAGLGLAAMTDAFRSSFASPYAASPQTDSATAMWQGTTALAADLGVEVGIPLAGTWSMIIGGGYHLARIRSMTAARDASYDTSGQPFVRKGTVLTDNAGSAIPFDFSGLHGSLGVRMSL